MFSKRAAGPASVGPQPISMSLQESSGCSDSRGALRGDVAESPDLSAESGVASFERHARPLPSNPEARERLAS